jgi:hypothetical protein
MNVQALLVRRRGILATLGIAVVACATLLIASPAQAGSGRVVISIGNRHTADCGLTYRPSYAEVEYARGFERGERQGYDEGFRDALAGRHFCNDVATCSGSRYFQDGFARGFAKAYAAGFEKGRCERIERERRAREVHHHHPHHHGHDRYVHNHGYAPRSWGRR